MAISEDVTPQSPIDEQPIIGLIGMGAMGTMYAKHLVNAGWKKCAPSCPDFARAADDDQTGFTSVISRASMMISRKHIKVSPCDTPPIWPLLLTFLLSDVPAITVLRDGHLVSRASDFILYSVEAEFIDNVVAQYGPCTMLVCHRSSTNVFFQRRSSARSFLVRHL